MADTYYLGIGEPTDSIVFTTSEDSAFFESLETVPERTT